MARILLVEDDRSIQQMIAQQLHEEGYEVACERDGGQALKTFTQRPTDGVILDVLLPGMSGFQVAEKIREMPEGKDIPIVMVSGIYRSSRHKETAQRFNVLAFIDKPFRVDQLLKPLREALGARGAAPVSGGRKATRPPAGAGEARKATTPADEVGGRKATGPAAGANEARKATMPPGAEGEARKATPPPWVHQGTLRERRFVWVLGELMRRRVTGSLLVQHGTNRKIVYLRDGATLAIRSNLLRECLGNVLVREKLITQAECDESVRQMRASNRRQGTILVEMGVISTQNVRFGLARQFEMRLFDLFGWEEGDYLFRTRDEMAGSLWTTEASPIALLYEGIRQGMPQTSVLAELSTRLDLRPVVADSPLLPLFAPLERAFLASLDGRATIRDIVAQKPMEDVASVLLAAMCTGVILPAAVAQPAPARAAAPAVAAPLSTPIAPAQAAPAPPAAQAAPAQAAPAQAKPALEPIAPEPAPVAQPAPAQAAARRAQPAPAAAPASGAPSPASARLGELQPILAALEGKNHWEVLGVGRGAAVELIRAAYHKLAKQYHPDRFALSDPGEKVLADKIFARIVVAHSVLTDAEERTKYEEELASGASAADAAEKVARVMAAEKAFTHGELAMRRRQFAEALAAFEQAVQLYDEEGEYHAFLGYALLLNHPADPQALERSQAEFDRAKRLNPKCDKAFLFNGYLHKSTGKMAKAETEFREATEINPQNVEAARELRLMAMRREKGDGKRGAR